MTRFFTFAAITLLLACDAGAPSPPGGSTTAEPPRMSPTAAATAVPADGLRVVRLRVEELTCKGCALQVREALQPLAGVSDVQTEVETKEVTVTYDPAQTDLRAAIAALSLVGYTKVEVAAE